MTFETIVNNIIGALDELVVVIVILSLVVFLYGLVVYLANVSSEEKRKDSIKYIVSGVVGLFVIIAIWGIVSVLANTAGFSFGIPQIQ